MPSYELRSRTWTSLSSGPLDEAGVAGAAGEAVAGVRAPLPRADEDLDGAADLGLHALVRDPVLQLDEPVVALADDLLRQRRQIGRRGAGPWGVLEGERA